MRLAIDCRCIGSSGIGTYIENIVSYLVNDNVHDDQFVLIGNPSHLLSYRDKPRCQIVPCLHQSFTLKELLRFPVKAVNQCDAFFTPNFNLPLGIRIPVFSTIHDVVFFDVDGLCSPTGKLIRRFFIWRALIVSRHVFTVSQFSCQRIKSLFHYKKDITIIHNGISQQLIDYRKKVQKERIVQGDYIVCLGNLKKYKGVKDLILAYQEARKKQTINYRLVIIGRFDFRTQDQEVISLLQHQDHTIQFITDADNETVYNYLSGAIALVSPSHYEGFGITPLEAMYLHTPVLISDIPTHREIYQGTPARFFKAGDITDLSRQLGQLSPGECDVDEIVANRYSYAITAKKIRETIRQRLDLC